MEVGALGSTRRPPGRWLRRVAAGTCAPGSYHLAGGGGSVSLLPNAGSSLEHGWWRPESQRRLLPLPPLLKAPLLRFLPVAFCWGRVGSEGVCGRRVAESRPEGSGQLAAGGASSERGGDCTVKAGGRGSLPCPHWGQQFSDCRTDCGAGAEILGVGLKGVFLVWKQCRGPSKCFTFSYFYLSCWQPVFWYCSFRSWLSNGAPRSRTLESILSVIWYPFNF